MNIIFYIFLEDSQSSIGRGSYQQLDGNVKTTLFGAGHKKNVSTSSNNDENEQSSNNQPNSEDATVNYAAGNDNESHNNEEMTSKTSQESFEVNNNNDNQQSEAYTSADMFSDSNESKNNLFI